MVRNVELIPIHPYSYSPMLDRRQTRAELVALMVRSSQAQSRQESSVRQSVPSALLPSRRLCGGEQRQAGRQAGPAANFLARLAWAERDPRGGLSDAIRLEGVSYPTSSPDSKTRRM